MPEDSSLSELVNASLEIRQHIAGILFKVLL
jgi:hypothetical protein